MQTVIDTTKILIDHFCPLIKKKRVWIFRNGIVTIIENKKLVRYSNFEKIRLEFPKSGGTIADITLVNLDTKEKHFLHYDNRAGGWFNFDLFISSGYIKEYKNVKV